MPNLYVRSGGNAGAWTGTYTTIALASAADAAGDYIYVASDHNESTAATQTWAFAGTNTNPVWVICGTTAAAPPTTSSTAGVVTTTGASGLAINGSCYIYGLTINIGTGAVNAPFVMDGVPSAAWQTYENVNINFVATGSNCTVVLGTAANAYPTKIHWKNVSIKFGSSLAAIRGTLAEFIWDGGSIASGSIGLSGGLIEPNSSGEYFKATISGVDLTNLGTSAYIADASAGGTIDVVLRNCKLPSALGGIVSGTLQARDRIELHNCDSGDTNYRLAVVDFCGAIDSSTAVYRNAGAQSDDGAQRFSWCMVSSSNVKFPHLTLRTPDIGAWSTATSGTVTATVEIAHNSQGAGANGVLLDSEIWLEVMFLGTSNVPLGSWSSDRVANLNLNGEAAAQASSSEAWTGTSTGWDTQKLSVSFEPKEAGYVIARVHLARAATVYVDPKLTLS
jgi:hypothetical protein